MRSGGDKTRQRIQLVALKLFAAKQYDQVTYCDLENATGLSRGAILYHIKNKETLFRQIVGTFVFKNNTLTSLEESKRKTLKDTIDNFMDQLSKEQKYWKKEGISNINYSLVNIQMSAYSLFPEFLEFAKEWYEREIAIWREVIENAISSGEIRKIDAAIFAEIFEDTYLGAAYAGLPEEDGYNIERVRHKLQAIYGAIQKD